MGSTNELDLTTIQCKEAQSKRVSYADAVVLHESSKKRVVLVPFYVRRTAGREMAIKIVTYQKAPPPNDWVVKQEASLSLNQEASEKLLKALKCHLEVAEQNADGDYIVLKVKDGVADVEKQDPAVVAQAIAAVLLDKDIVSHLKGHELSTELVTAFKSLIHLQELRMALSELRLYLDDSVNDEGVYQKWCEKHSWVFGNTCVVSDKIRNISANDKVDLLIPSLVAGYRDLVELKTPNVPVLRYDQSHTNYYFSSDVSKAIGQCHRYMDVLHAAAEKGLLDHPEIVAYHPRATIVIGRSQGWQVEQLKALHGLNRRLNGITVMTYDQLLLQGERLLEIVTKEESDQPLDCDDFPF